MRRAWTLVLVVIAAACTRSEGPRIRTASPDAKPGGTIVVGITEPVSIDPGATSAFDPSGSLVVATMCDRLIGFDPLTGRPVPSIAESWQVTDGGRRITVKIRKGLRFHDGTEVTSEDIGASLARVIDPETASPVSDLLRDVKGFGELRGTEVAEGPSDELELDGFSAIDRFSFELALDARRADLVRVLGHPLAAPVPRKVATGDPLALVRNPVCAGPYKLEAPFDAGAAAITLIRDERYVATNTAYTRGGRGWADRIEFRIFPDRAAQLDAFVAGAIDVAHVPSERLSEARALGDAFVRSPAPVLEYIGLPVGTPPFDRRAVRIALSQAIDRRAIVETVYGGGRFPATGFLPPTLGDELYDGDGCGPNAPEAGDVEAAKRTLADAGVDLNGRTAPVYFNDEFANRALIDAVTARWRDAFGFEAVPSALGWEALLSKGTAQAGFDGPFRMAWAAQYASADQYLRPLFEAAAVGRDNLTRFSNREFEDRLDKEAQRATDASDRDEAYIALQKTVCSEMPAVPVAFGATYHLVRVERVGSANGSPAELSSGQVAIRELFVKG